MTNEQVRALPKAEKEALRAKADVAHSDCLQRGYALQTYSSSYGAAGSGGSFAAGGSGASHFNQAVYEACMNVYGFEKQSVRPTVFGWSPF